MGWVTVGWVILEAIFIGICQWVTLKFHGVSSCSLFKWLSKGKKDNFQTQPLILKEWVYPRVIWCVEGPQSRKWTRLEETVHSLIQHPTNTGWWFGTFFILSTWTETLPAGVLGWPILGVSFTRVVFAMALWGSAGPQVTWGYPPSLEIGGKCDIVAEVISVTDDAVLVTVLPSRVKAKLLGSLEIPAECATISLFDATLVQKDPMPVFIIDDPTDALLYGRGTRESFTNLIDLCSGMGIGTIGFQASGMAPVCAAEWSPPLAEAFRSMHPDVPCISGDIASKETLKCLYRAHPKPAVVMCGFSCQPF